MIKHSKYPLLLLLVALITTSRAFDQKKNSIVYQNGILNYFYDHDPVLVNTINLKYVRRIRDFSEEVLSKSRGINYTRTLNSKSNITLIGSFFRAYNTKKSLSTYEFVPAVTLRKWYFIAAEYNRKIVDKTKFQLFYGGGLTYRNGFEMYHVFSYPAFIVNGQIGYEGVSEFIEKIDLGTTMNMNMKYTFWKSFFLYSKLDIQYYFYEFEKARVEFQKVLDINPARKYPPRRKINHTFTIGVGMDF